MFGNPVREVTGNRVEFYTAFPAAFVRELVDGWAKKSQNEALWQRVRRIVCPPEATDEVVRILVAVKQGVWSDAEVASAVLFGA